MGDRHSAQTWMNLRERGWRDPVARSVTALTLLLALGGLSVFLLPFSVFNQHTVLVHTLLGLPYAALLGVYMVKHILAWTDAPLTHAKLTGWASGIAAVVCAASGLVLAAQAEFGRQIGQGWRLAHIVSTFALIAFLAPHLIAVIVALARQRSEPAAAAAWSACVSHARVAVVITVAGLAGTALLCLAVQPPQWDNSFPADYDATAYGDLGPFAPSLATTSTGGAFDPRSLSGSAYCGTSGCHEEIYREWLPSAHRYASLDPAFQGIQNIMATQNGPVSTRYCGGCHDPISLFSGTKNIGVDNLSSLTGYQEGLSCLVCHAIEQTDVKGNANYVVHQPVTYAWESRDDAVSQEVSDFLIRAYPAQHVESLSRRMFKAPEFCAACHKQFIDKEVNRVGWVQLQNQYDNWKASRWHDEQDPTRTLECRECHMPLVDSQDPAAGDGADRNRSPDDGKHRSHSFLGANQFIPVLSKLEGGAEHAARTEHWLRGEIEIPEIADRWTTGAAIPISIEAPDSVTEGQDIALKVHVVNNKAGHDFPTGPLDIIQAWVEVEVTDEAGQVVFHSGKVDERRMIETGSFMFKAEPVDRYGNLIDRHNLWEMVGVRFKRALFPGSEEVASYTLDCSGALDLLPAGNTDAPIAPGTGTEAVAAAAPAAGNPADVALAIPAITAGKLRVHAKLNYRKIDQYLLNTMFDESKGVTAPVTVLSEADATILVQPAPAGTR